MAVEQLYWKGPWCLGRPRLNVSQRCALAAKVVKVMLGCMKRSTAGRWEKWLFPSTQQTLSRILCPVLALHHNHYILRIILWMINDIILLIWINWKEFGMGRESRAGINVWGLEHLVYKERLRGWGLFSLKERRLLGRPTAAASIHVDVIKMEPGSSLLQQSCQFRQDH